VLVEEDIKQETSRYAELTTRLLVVQKICCAAVVAENLAFNRPNRCRRHSRLRRCFEGVDSRLRRQIWREGKDEWPQ
jgi:hypothetical protein